MTAEERERLICEAIVLSAEWQHLQRAEIEVSARRKAIFTRLHTEPVDGEGKGMSLRGIAAELNISYPRVHEVIKGRKNAATTDQAER